MASLNIVNDVDRHVLTSLDDVKAVVDIVNDVDRHRCRCRQVSEPPTSALISGVVPAPSGASWGAGSFLADWQAGSWLLAGLAG